jgi:protein-disulfide isomerase/uncharacterized membrane protein
LCRRIDYNPTMSSRFRTLLFWLSVAGLATMVASAYVTYRLATDPGFVSPCDVNATVSCTDAYLSAYGSLWGMPVALIGLCWFAAAVLLQISARAAAVPQPENVPGYLFVASVPALAFALYLAYAAFFILHTVCLLCLTADVCIIAIFVLSGIATEFSMTSFPGRVARDLKMLMARPIALAVLLLFVLGAASALAYFPREGGATAAYSSSSSASSNSAAAGADGQAAGGAQAAASNDSPEVQQLERYLDSSPKAMIPVDVSAPVIIVKFNDYQCPPCKQTYDLYKPLHEKWDREAPGKVKWVIKNFPLEPECNGTVQRQVHQFACEAAAGVLMAKQHNKGEALEDWIFANQPTLTLDSLKQAIHDIGAVPDYDAQYPRVLNDIKADAQLGGLLGVGSTPTFFFNGVKIPPQAPDVMDALIVYALKKAPK